MAYCGPLGLPHSQFLRWRPADRAAALAWMDDSQQRHSACGTHPADFEQGAPRWRAVQVQCLGCQLIEAERKNVNKAVAGFTSIHLEQVPELDEQDVPHDHTT